MTKYIYKSIYIKIKNKKRKRKKYLKRKKVFFYLDILTF